MPLSLILNHIEAKNTPGHHTALCLSVQHSARKATWGQSLQLTPHCCTCTRAVCEEVGRGSQSATLDHEGCSERDRRWLRRAWQMPFSPPNAGSPPEVKASIRGQRSSAWSMHGQASDWTDKEIRGHRILLAEGENISEEALVWCAPVH